MSFFWWCFMWGTKRYFWYISGTAWNIFILFEASDSWAQGQQKRGDSFFCQMSSCMSKWGLNFLNIVPCILSPYWLTWHKIQWHIWVPWIKLHTLWHLNQLSTSSRSWYMGVNVTLSQSLMIYPYECMAFHLIHYVKLIFNNIM